MSVNSPSPVSSCQAVDRQNKMTLTSSIDSGFSCNCKIREYSLSETNFHLIVCKLTTEKTNEVWILQGWSENSTIIPCVQLVFVLPPALESASAAKECPSSMYPQHGLFFFWVFAGGMSLFVWTFVGVRTNSCLFSNLVLFSTCHPL